MRKHALTFAVEAMLNRVAIGAQELQIIQGIVRYIFVLVMGLKNFYVLFISTFSALLFPTRRHKKVSDSGRPTPCPISTIIGTKFSPFSVEFGSGEFPATKDTEYRYSLRCNEQELASVRTKLLNFAAVCFAFEFILAVEASPGRDRFDSSRVFSRLRSPLCGACT